MKIVAMNFLQRDPLRYADMRSALASGRGEVLWAENAGVLLYDAAANLHLLAVEKERALPRFLSKIHRAKLVTVHQSGLVQPIALGHGLHLTMACRQAVWTKADAPVYDPSKIQVRKLGQDMAMTICQRYSHDIGLAYIEERLRAGELYGAFFNGTLAGFIGLHPEGSMGMLEVMPACRRQGVGEALLSWLCSRQIERGRIPFSQFVKNNVPSCKLHEKMGFDISPHMIYWLEP